MSVEKSPAELKFAQALQATMDLLHFPDKKYIYDTKGEYTVRLYEEALSLGLTGNDEIECHARLGGVFFFKGQYFEGLDKVFAEGLDNTPSYQRYAREMEKALELDAQRGGEFFRYYVDRETLLKPLGLLWGANSKFIKKSGGHSYAISYLEQKIRLVDYIEPYYLLMAYFELGSLYAEIVKGSTEDRFGNRAKAIKYFERAANAKVPPNDLPALDIKRHAQEALERETLMSQPVGDTRCFIATAVYERDDAPELELLRCFRDEFLLKSLTGKLFVFGYYAFSRNIAELIKKSEFTKKLVRAIILKPTLRLIRRMMN